MANQVISFVFGRVLVVYVYMFICLHLCHFCEVGCNLYVFTSLVVCIRMFVRLGVNFTFIFVLCICFVTYSGAIKNTFF